MKLRWSNNRNYAMPFEANDLGSFQEQALSALRSFIIATERRMHRGEIHKTVSCMEMVSLHIYLDDAHGWYNPGLIKATDTASFGRIQRFQPLDVSMPYAEADDLAGLFDKAGRWFSDGAPRYWQACFECWQWINSINLLVMQIDDEIGRRIDGKCKSPH